MLVGLVPLLAPAAISAATAIVFCLFLLAISDWWLPQQPDATTPRYHYFTRLGNWTKRKLRDSIIAARKKLVSALSNAIARRSPGAVLALHQAAELVNRTAGTFADESRQTYQALYALRHVTVPNLIAGALRDPLRRIGVVEAQAQAALTTLTGVSTAFADGLRALPWGVPLGLQSRVETFFTTYKRLWDKVWLELAPRVTELWTQIVPELRARIEALERAGGGGAAGGLAAIRNRVTALENQAGNIILPRIANLEAAVQALSDEVFGGVGTGLLALAARVQALEDRLDDFIATTLTALEARVLAIETELEQGIAEGLDRFGEHILELERQVTTVLPQRIAALELAVDTLVATALGGLEVGLIDLAGRVVSLETQIRDVILPGFDAILGRVQALEERIESVILPRIQAIEDLLAPAAFAALVLATMRQVAPNLFCRNTTSVTQRICGLDETLLAQLLAGTLLFALVLDPKLVARTGAEVENVIDGAFRTMADL